VKTALTELLGIEAPIIQGSLGPWSSVGLTAAICEAGALGTLGTAIRSADDVRADIAALREQTERPFAVNHTLRPFGPEAWEATLAESPPVVSLALGHRPDLVEEAHEVGAIFVQQVHTVEQAERAVEAGADVIIAQGTEAGGFGGWISTLALVPRVVDAVAPVPVAAAVGGCRQGGVRSRHPPAGQRGFVRGCRPARPADAVRRAVEHRAGGGAARRLRARAGGRGGDPRRARARVPRVQRPDRRAIDDVLPVREIVRSLVEGAERALARGD
jgi:enoyl-[acyl-carrier protein] reductase II